MSNLFGQTEEEIYNLPFENLKEYASNYDVHWQIKIFRFFSERYPNLKTQLLTEAWEIAKLNGIIKQYEHLTSELQLTPDDSMATYVDMYYTNRKFEAIRFKQEQSVRHAKACGTPENYRRYLLDLALIDEKIGDYEPCIENLMAAYQLSMTDLRPHAIYMKIVYMYMLTGAHDILQDFVACSKYEKFNSDRHIQRKHERHIIKFISILYSANFDRAIKYLFTNVDLECIYKYVFIIPPVQIGLILALLTWSSLSLCQTSRVRSLLHNIDMAAQCKYELMEMFIALCDRNFHYFFDKLKNLTPRIYNDIILYRIADQFINRIIENVIYQALSPFYIININSLSDMVNFPPDVVVKCVSEFRKSKYHQIDENQNIIRFDLSKASIQCNTAKILDGESLAEL